MGSLEVTKTI